MVGLAYPCNQDDRPKLTCYCTLKNVNLSARNTVFIFSIFFFAIYYSTYVGGDQHNLMKPVVPIARSLVHTLDLD